MEIQPSTTNTAVVPAESSHNAPVAQEVLLAAIENSQSLDALAPAMTLTAEYIELEKPSESFRGIFLGFSEIQVTDKSTGELRSIPAARFVINKAVFVNAGAVLISELKRAGVPVGTPLEVCYERKEGNTKIYSITLLA